MMFTKLKNHEKNQQYWEHSLQFMRTKYLSFDLRFPPSYKDIQSKKMFLFLIDRQNI